MSGSYANRYRSSNGYGYRSSESETGSSVGERDWCRKAWFATVISMAAGFALFLHMTGWA